MVHFTQNLSQNYKLINNCSVQYPMTNLIWKSFMLMQVTLSAAL